MNALIMSNVHQTAAQAAGADTPWEWVLAPQQARTLAASAQPRWLQVTDGAVWLTRVHAAPRAAVCQAERSGAVDPAEDVWLQAGQTVALPAGSVWVAEGWPQARFSLLLQGPAPQRADGVRIPSRIAARLGAWAAPQSRHELHPAPAGTLA